MSEADVVDHGKHDGLIVKKVPHMRGVGVFATRLFQTSDVVVRYMGKKITRREALVLEEAHKDVRVLVVSIACLVAVHVLHVVTGCLCRIPNGQ